MRKKEDGDLNKSRSVPIVIVESKDYPRATRYQEIAYSDVRIFDFLSLFLFDRSSSLSLSLLYYTQLYNIYTDI